MKELQSLLGEANQMTRHVDTKLSMPILAEWVLYEVANTTIGMPVGTGRMQELESDYRQSNGIGAVVPPITWLSDVLTNIQWAASQIIAVAAKHTRTLQEVAELAQQHIVHTFPHAKNASRWGFFRIQITAKSVVFQILFLSGNGIYVTAYEWDLQKMADGSAFEAPPFSRLPPLLEVPSHHGSTLYVPATYENVLRLINDTPHNAPPRQLHRSHTAKVFEKTAEMAEDLLAA